MALSVNTNLFSLNAQRNLRKTETPLRTAMQRLSSGLRINSARDDAAGLAISARMITQSRALSVAVRNANDGVSFAQTAEGAMDEMTNGLQRIYELAEQSASNNTSADRTSMNQEVSQLISELGRIVSQTRYNGETFLNQNKSISVQVGTEVGETISISSTNVDNSTLGVSTTYTTSLTYSDVATAAFSVYNSSGLADTASLGGADLGAAITTATDYQNNAVNILNRLNSKSGDTGVDAFMFGNALVASSLVTAATTSATVSAGYLTVNGTQIGSFVSGTAVSTGAANLASAINAKTSTTGVQAVLVASSERIILSNTTGATISVSEDTSKLGSGATAFRAGFGSTASVSSGGNGKIILNGTLTTTSVDADGVETAGALGYGTSSATLTLSATNMNSVSITTQGGAYVAMLATKKAIDTINSSRATLGAAQNRLDSTISNLENVKENVEAARARIQDADFAAETANLTKSLILQQAGISVLSQANTLTQNVLALLQG